MYIYIYKTGERSTMDVPDPRDPELVSIALTFVATYTCGNLLARACVRTHTYTHTQIRARIDIHIDTHKLTHASVRTRAHTHTHELTHTHAHAHAHTHTHTCTCTSTHKTHSLFLSLFPALFLFFSL